MAKKNSYITAKTFFTTIIVVLIAISGWIFALKDNINKVDIKATEANGAIIWIKDRLEKIEEDPEKRAYLQGYMKASVSASLFTEHTTTTEAR